MIQVSVIIPTYKDWDRLGLCLDALAQQQFPASEFEVIVVNNNTEDQVPGSLVLRDNCKIVVCRMPFGLPMQSGFLNSTQQ
jgi:cellulose synthase/poly-beta-1,6-N-acetylglucosamine synthase-like glycosyltransferase